MSDEGMSRTRPVPPAGSLLVLAPARIGAARLVVADMEKVAAFYESILGLERIARQGDVLLLGRGDALFLELQGLPGARRASPHEAGLFHIAFLLPTRADLGAWLRHAAAARVRLQGASDHEVSEAIYLADPEGNGIEVYADRPSVLWRQAQGMVTMGTRMLDLDEVLAAGATQAWNGMPAGGMIGHMHLQVGEIDAAERFYQALLGFELTCRYPGGSFFGLGGYHHQLATNVWNRRGAGPRPAGLTGLARFEILTTQPDVLAAMRERLLAASVPVEEEADGLVVRDPWGTAIRIRPAA